MKNSSLQVWRDRETFQSLFRILKQQTRWASRFKSFVRLAKNSFFFIFYIKMFEEKIKSSLYMQLCNQTCKMPLFFYFLRCSPFKTVSTTYWHHQQHSVVYSLREAAGTYSIQRLCCCSVGYRRPPYWDIWTGKQALFLLLLIADNE